MRLKARRALAPQQAEGSPGEERERGDQDRRPSPWRGGGRGACSEARRPEACQKDACVGEASAGLHEQDLVEEEVRDGLRSARGRVERRLADPRHEHRQA